MNETLQSAASSDSQEKNKANNLEKQTLKIAIKIKLHALDSAQANIIKRKFAARDIIISRVYRDALGRAVVLLNVTNVPNSNTTNLERITEEFAWEFSRHDGQTFLQLTYKPSGNGARYREQLAQMTEIN